MEEKMMTREEEKSETSAESQPQKVPSKSLSAKYCLVCFCLFNGNERRPRNIPCGHTFCSECVTSTIRDLIFICPSCRKTYQATSVNTFPISYIVEELISEAVTGDTTDNNEVSDDSIKSLKPISRRLKSQVTEALSEVEILSCEGSSLRSQLQFYTSYLDEWKSDHQHFTSQLDEMVREINREKTRIETSLEEEVMVRTEMEQTADSLKRQDKTLKILEDLEKVHLSSENFEEWIKTTDESFPNMELITRSQLLRKQYQMGPVSPSASVVEEEHEEECARASLSLNQGTSLDERCPTSSMTIQEKIKSALLSISHGSSVKAVQMQCNSLESKAIQTDCQESLDLLLKAEDAVDKRRLLGHILLGRQFLVLQEEESGKKQYARLSLDEKQRVLLHGLGEECIHLKGSPSIIKYEEILHHVPCTSRRTFLEFGVDGRSIGRVFISLIDEGNYPENFQNLCLGRERGLSYRHSNILIVWNKGTESECINLGDYERNDESGGRAVVSGVDWKKERERDIYRKTYTEAGFVQGRIDNSGATMSQFYINTRDRNAICGLPCFGKVVEGLDVIRDIADRYNNKNIKKVKIIDCGVVLST